MPDCNLNISVVRVSVLLHGEVDGIFGKAAATLRQQIAFAFPHCSDRDVVPAMNRQYPKDLEEIEIQLFTEGVYRHYGFELRDFALATLTEKAWNCIEMSGTRPGKQDLQKNSLVAGCG